MQIASIMRKVLHKFRGPASLPEDSPIGRATEEKPFIMAKIEDKLPWFDSEGFMQSVASSALTEEEKSWCEDFARDGFIVCKNSVPEELCDEAIAAFNGWHDRNERALSQFRNEQGKLERIINIHSRLKVFNKLFSENKLTNVQDFLFRDETVLYTSLFFERGSAQDIHRDLPLFWTNPAYHYFGVWVALEDVNEDNGPLLVYEGGHKIPAIDRGAIGKKFYSDLSKIPSLSEDVWKEYQSQVVKHSEELGLKKREVHVKKGDTILWHPLLPHGGKHIIDFAKTRKSFVMHTTPKDVPVFHSNVFFNPEAEVGSIAPWRTEIIEGSNRSRAMTGELSLGHGIEFDFETLK